MLMIPAGLGIVLLIGILTGCADPDGAVGNGVLGNHLTGQPHQIVLYPEVDTLSHTAVPTGSSSFLHLGHAAHFNSSIVMKVTSFPALQDSFVLDSAVVTLAPSEVIRDSVVSHEGTATLSWIADPWNDATVVRDSLPNWDSYLSSPTTLTVTPVDSAYLVFPLPPDTVRSWIDGDSSNQGFRLEMTDNPGFIYRYFSSEGATENRPTVTLYYTWYDSGASGWQAHNADTVAYANHDASIVSEDLDIQEDILMLGNGIQYSCLLKFNLANLLPTFGVSIHYADLTMWLKSDDPLNFGSVPTAVRQLLESPSWLEDPLHPDVAAAVSQAVLIGADSLYISSTYYVIDWVVDPSGNYGAMIRSGNSGYDLARQVFYSRAASDSTLWPSLRIIYTVTE
jgi:hypothetical protein